MAAGEPLLQLRDVTQDYGGLRPLRVKAFDLHAGDRVAILGMERGAAEVLVNLVTGATTPRTGEVRAFGRLTTDITDSETWLEALRAYGLLGVRTVLVEQLNVLQNLALPGCQLLAAVASSAAEEHAKGSPLVMRGVT